MNTSAIIKNAGRTFSMFGLKFRKHSPEILSVVGAVGTVASAVMACKATTKVNDILEDTKSQLDSVHGVLNGEIETTQSYTEEDAKKDTALIYVQTGIKFAKLYGPSIALGALSLGAMLTSNHILRKRNVALAAAYATIDKGFKEYRGRVIERFGQEIDKELKYGIKAQKVSETVVDEETGEVKEVEKSVNVINGVDGYSDYARFFDDGCAPWKKDSEYNLMFLRAQQRYANDLLQANGYLFLNDVYDMLGIPRTKAGQIVGWVYNEAMPTGDNRVDFGIYDVNRQETRDFVNGYERSILLDFNVDGNILDLI